MKCTLESIGINTGGLWGHDLQDFWDRESLGLYEILIYPYNAQESEMRTLSKVVTFQK